MDDSFSYRLKWTIIKCIVMTIITIINAIGGFFDLFGVKLYRLTKERVYSIFDKESLQEVEAEPNVKLPLDLMIQGLENDEQQPLFRRIIFNQIFKEILEKRVMIKRTLRQHPEILDIKLTKPMFLIGLPRTGTTFLLWLLAQDKVYRAPTLWELAELPLGPTENYKQDPRYQKVEFSIHLEKWQRQNSKVADAGHPSEPDMPEECLVVFWRSFWQYLHPMALDCLTAHESWYYSQTREQMREHYGFYKKQLQMLTYRHPDMENRHFLMKAHVHLLELDSLIEAFPDGCLLYTHRALSEVVPSHMSLMYNLLNNYGFGDRDKLIKRVLRLIRELTVRCVRVMKKYDTLPGKNPIFIIMYKDLIKDPVYWMKRTYDYYGIEWTDQTEDSLKNYLTNDPKKKKYGKHNYSLSDFGLTKEMLREEFAEYYDYFKDKTDDVI